MWVLGLWREADLRHPCVMSQAAEGTTMARLEIPFTGKIVLSSDMFSDAELIQVGQNLLANLQRQVNDSRAAKMKIEPGEPRALVKVRPTDTRQHVIEASQVLESPE